nr:MAG TPA: hypothetical protein [Caudoviricetes sp.]
MNIKTHHLIQHLNNVTYPLVLFIFFIPGFIISYKEQDVNIHFVKFFSFLFVFYVEIRNITAHYKFTSGKTIKRRYHNARLCYIPA